LGLVTALLPLALAILSACGSSGPAAGDSREVQRYQLRGKVVNLESDNQAALIEHEEIVGWMDAMTMRFPVREKADWEKLAVGAQIEATVFVADDGFYVGEVQVVETTGQQQSEPEMQQ
jgi:Cu/Ag efflux protein CusF